MLLPWTLEALDASLMAIHNAWDAWELRALKKFVIKAFQKEWEEKEAFQAEALVLQAQVERNTVIVKKARPKVSRRSDGTLKRSDDKLGVSQARACGKATSD